MSVSKISCRYSSRRSCRHSTRNSLRNYCRNSSGVFLKKYLEVPWEMNLGVHSGTRSGIRLDSWERLYKNCWRNLKRNLCWNSCSGFFRSSFWNFSKNPLRKSAGVHLETRRGMWSCEKLHLWRNFFNNSWDKFRSVWRNFWIVSVVLFLNN